jgi:Skp family chaperone for outer membrane proteins
MLMTHCFNIILLLFSQSNPKIKANEIDSLYEALLTKMNQHMSTMKSKIQDQRNAEERERLRQIQLKMDAERKAKEAEEQRLKEEEENRRKKVKVEYNYLFEKFSNFNLFSHFQKLSYSLLF